ncbi:BQ5605_C015g07996 [Microbotryum silenes-dioicae]|uniref:BQ5605_C015g07996 protein n=1 Tax=Microbotryum silenes-dioicae TaxID=796604 RepID=A0A2X0NXR6_9BASI|nr:BQ5605_C015g07996 [Microbotryum silenes-dioicae]
MVHSQKAARDRRSPKQRNHFVAEDIYWISIPFVGVQESLFDYFGGPRLAASLTSMWGARSPVCDFASDPYPAPSASLCALGGANAMIRAPPWSLVTFERVRAYTSILPPPRKGSFGSAPG